MRLRTREDCDAIAGSVPSSVARDWVGFDTIGIEATDGALRILIEKDFACLEPREGEDDEDAFPHPAAK